jgi:hypothetical protein
VTVSARHVTSANVHIVPATTNVRGALLEVSGDDIVPLGGSLIAVHRIDRADDARASPDGLLARQ